MVSTRQKGNQFQDRIQGWLKKRKWIVHNQKSVSSQIPIKGKMIWISKRQDIFGCFDLIAKKNGETLWIQATLHKSLKEKIKKIKDANLTFGDSEFPMVFLKRESHIDVYGFDEIGEIVHSGEPSLYGKIIRGKFYASEGINWQF